MSKDELRAWALSEGRENALCEVVLRVKTAEANRLLAAGHEAELDYLLTAYEGQEEILAADITDMLAMFRYQRRGGKRG